ncbi:hypothetical protein PSTT_11631 [Puccinia striiformis]|uniref:Uncharacterized protein n=1 Tax=Puccinia striiformis TaxID=27350 RepID=A0A2S4UZK1_9BASI|nr:hypothetical protein PSTT_11631 [Puccinia striiformis]
MDGTASEVSVLVSVRASSEKQGTADKVAHQRPRNAMTELDPTLQGSVDQVRIPDIPAEIPAQLTQVDLAQDGQFHDVGRPSPLAPQTSNDLYLGFQP